MTTADPCYYCGTTPATQDRSQTTAHKLTGAIETRQLHVCSACGPRVPTVLFLTQADDRELKTLMPAPEGP